MSDEYDYMDVGGVLHRKDKDGNMWRHQEIKEVVGKLIGSSDYILWTTNRYTLIEESRMEWILI